RSAQESLLVWAGFAKRSDKTGSAYRDYIKSVWKTATFPSSGYLTFEEFWNTTLHDGCYQAGSHVMVEENIQPVVNNVTPLDTTHTLLDPVVVTMVSGNIGDAAAKLVEMQKSSKSWEVVLYEKVGMGTGNQFTNPILQELPDPITRVVWDNYIT